MISIKVDRGLHFGITAVPAAPQVNHFTLQIDSPYFDFSQDSAHLKKTEGLNSPCFEEVLSPEVTCLQLKRLRKCKDVGMVLRQFKRYVNGHERNPKLENIRYRVMRSLKKFIRRMLSHKQLTSRGLLDIKEHINPMRLSQLTVLCEQHQESLERFASLSNGPAVDHRGQHAEVHYHTYNNEYMKSIFRNPEIREVYQGYVELLFNNDNAGSLCRRFKIWCCDQSEHEFDCIEKWREFKRILLEYLGADV